MGESGSRCCGTCIFCSDTHYTGNPCGVRTVHVTDGCLFITLLYLKPAQLGNKATAYSTCFVSFTPHLFQEEALRDTSNQKYDEAVSSVELSHMQDKLDRTSKDLQQKQDELETAKRDLEKTEKELTALRTETAQLKSDIAKLESEKRENDNKLQAEKKESSYWESKASEFETDLQVCELTSG